MSDEVKSKIIAGICLIGIVIVAILIATVIPYKWALCSCIALMLVNMMLEVGVKIQEFRTDRLVRKYNSNQ